MGSVKGNKWGFCPVWCNLGQLWYQLNSSKFDNRRLGSQICLNKGLGYLEISQNIVNFLTNFKQMNFPINQWAFELDKLKPFIYDIRTKFLERQSYYVI